MNDRRTRRDMGGGFVPAALSIVWCVACAQILGVPDYRNGEGDNLRDAGGRSARSERDAVANDVSPPPLVDDRAPYQAKPPWLSSSACVACEDDNCSAERAACPLDPVCALLLSPSTDGPAPLHHYTDFNLPPVSDALWDWEHGDGGPYPLDVFIGRAVCLNTHCADACELGRDFSCVGKYDWPPSTAGERHLRYQFLDEGGNPWEGLDVHLCGAVGACLTPSDWWSEGMTDHRGYVELDVDLGARPEGPTGYVLIDGGLGDASGRGTYPASISLGPAPLESGFYESEALVTKVRVDQDYIALGGATLQDFDGGPIWAYPRDCNGDFARGVQVDVLVTRTVGSYDVCTGCDRPLYTDDGGDPVTALKEMTSVTSGRRLAGRAIVGSVPPGHALVVARDTVTHRPVGVQELMVHPGTIQYARFYPLSRRQLELYGSVLANLPDVLR